MTFETSHAFGRVIAIDPGYDRLGVAILDGDGNKPVIIHSTCLTTDPHLPFPDRLKQAGDTFHILLTTYSPQILAIETLFFNRNVKTALNVAQMRGVLLYLARDTNCEVREFSPQAIKVAVTGYGGSDKVAVKAMLQRLVPGVPATALDDEYDAIAVGITCLAHQHKSR